MEIGKYTTVGVRLGQGAFGTVELATDGKKQIAIKCIEKDHIVQENMGIQVSKEVSILKQLKHKNIVYIEEVLMSPGYLYIIMEYVKGGELFSKIAQTGGKIPEDLCKRYVYQICDALEYCHNLNVCHRDIKPQNILLDEKDNIKLVDFGFATIMEMEDTTDFDEFNRGMEAQSHKMRETHTLCGTDAYMAPELVSRKKYMGDKADIWAMGTVAYFLITGSLPFRKFDVKRLLYDTLDLSPEQKDFISKCLDVVPENRYSARRLLLHEWIFDSKRLSNSSSDTKENIEISSSSSEDEDEITISFCVNIGSRNKKNLIDYIKEELSKNEWKMKDQNSLEIIKVSKKNDSGFDMINIILHESTDRMFNIDIKNGSAMKMATFQSKHELKNILSNLEY